MTEFISDERPDEQVVFDHEYTSHNRLPPSATVAADGPLDSGCLGIQVEWTQQHTARVVDSGPRRDCISATAGSAGVHEAAAIGASSRSTIIVIVAVRRSRSKGLLRYART